MGEDGNWTDRADVNDQVKRILAVAKEHGDDGMHLLVLSVAMGVQLQDMPDDMVNSTIDRVVRYSGKTVERTVIHTVDGPGSN